MNRWFLVVLCSAAALGCGGDGEQLPYVSTPESEAVPLPAAESLVAQTTIKGMKLEMHDSSPTRGMLRKPVFSATTEEATRGSGNTYTAKGISARAQREGDIPVTFEAAEATIDQDNNVAELRGGVELQAGDIVMNLADVTWDAKSGTARSDHALTFGDGSTELTASGMELNARDRTYVLRNPSGRIRLKRQEGSL